MLTKKKSLSTALMKPSSSKKKTVSLVLFTRSWMTQPSYLEALFTSSSTAVSHSTSSSAVWLAQMLLNSKTSNFFAIQSTTAYKTWQSMNVLTTSQTSSTQSMTFFPPGASLSQPMTVTFARFARWCGLECRFFTNSTRNIMDLSTLAMVVRTWAFCSWWIN